MKKIALLVVFFAATYALACLNISGRNLDGESTELDFITFFSEYSIPEKKTEKEIREEMNNIKRWIKNANSDERRDELYCDMGAWMIYQDKFQEAIDYMHKNVKSKYKNYSYYSNLGVAHELNGNMDSAYYWTQKGVETNPDSHWGSEWIHLKILEAQLAMEDDPNWLDNNNVLGYKLGQDSIPLEIPDDADPAGLCHEIVYQLYERTYWVKPENKVVGNLLLALADIYSKYWDTKESIGTYELAVEYDPDLKEVVDKRLDYIYNLLAKEAGISNPIPRHKHDHESDEVANGDDFKLSTEIKDGAYPKSFRPTEKEWSTIVLISSIIGLVILSAAIIIWRYRRKSS